MSWLSDFLNWLATLLGGNRTPKTVSDSGSSSDSLSIPPSDPVLLFSTAYWDVWAPPQLPATFQARIKSYVDLVISQISSDLGIAVSSRYSLYIQNENSGTFGTPSPKGPGVFMGYNIATWDDPFWFLIAVLHESVNQFTGQIAEGWVWADGSPLWGGSSPFPNACDILMLAELGYAAQSTEQAGRMESDPRVQLFYNIAKAGWQPFRDLFTLVKQKGITSWYNWPEPTRTALLVALLSKTTGTDQLPAFIAAGIAVASTDVANAKAILGL